MRKDYEEMVRKICHLSNWKAAPLAERHGAVGVACVMAYIRGVKANVADLAAHIGVLPSDVDTPFKRLLVNGVFSSKYDVRNDIALYPTEEIAQAVSSGKTVSATVPSVDEFQFEQQSRTAWAIIAGISGGFCGLRESLEAA